MQHESFPPRALAGGLYFFSASRGLDSFDATFFFSGLVLEEAEGDRAASAAIPVTRLAILTRDSSEAPLEDEGATRETSALLR